MLIFDSLTWALAALAAHDTTLLVVTHEVGPLADVVDRAVVLQHGRVVHDGPLVPELLGASDEALERLQDDARLRHQHVHHHEHETAPPPGWVSDHREHRPVPAAPHPECHHPETHPPETHRA